MDIDVQLPYRPLLPHVYSYAHMEDPPLFFNERNLAWRSLLVNWVFDFKIVLHDMEYETPSALSAYCASICIYPEDAKDIVGLMPNDAVLRLSSVPSNHGDRPDLYMAYILDAKFRQCLCAQKALLATGNRHLFYYTPGNLYWGVDAHGVGKNVFGKLLMRIRSSYQKGDQNGHECPVTTL